MYLHIGNGMCLKEKNIIAILDIDYIKNTKEYKKFYERLLEEKKVIDISKENKKSLILVKENGIEKAYISNINANTIGKRK